LTGLDWCIVAGVALLAAFGFRQGFVVGLLSVAGFAGGAFLGTRLGPALLSDGAESPYAPLFGLFGALVGGAILATGLEGLGELLRGSLLRAIPGARAVDGLLGAVLAAGLGLALAWLGGAVALQTPGARELRRDIQRSEILSRLNDVLPPSGPILNALARFDPFPQIDGPDTRDGAPPRRGIARDPQVRAAEGSAVRVLGTACGLGVSGSGWVAAAQTVVTNAHVVAGQDDTTVQLRGEGPRLEAVAIAFDARNDVAVLRVPGLRAPALALADDPPRGRSAAVVGFPRNGPLRVRPARLGATQEVLSQDAYGHGSVRRSITALRGVVQPGNSGGPVVDGAGRVVTTVFAAARGGGPPTGYGVPNAVVGRVLAAAGPGQVSTGPCAR
jgi:S1-C subfamily serine protease